MEIDKTDLRVTFELNDSGVIALILITFMVICCTTFLVYKAGQLLNNRQQLEIKIFSQLVAAKDETISLYRSLFEQTGTANTQVMMKLTDIQDQLADNTSDGSGGDKLSKPSQ